MPYLTICLSSLLAQAKAPYKGERRQPRLFSQFIAYKTSLERAASQMFWKCQFCGLNAATFPIIHLPKQDLPSSRGSHDHKMNVPCWQGFGFTLPVIIQLARGIFICHYTNSEDVLYGFSMPAQNIIHMEHTTGPITAAVPLRI